MKTTVYHNPSCSKSCAALDLLRQEGEELRIVEYLHDTPSFEELKELVALLGIRPEELVRKNEPAFLEHFSGKDLSDDQWIQAMTDFPILIERPVIVRGNKAIIGRPATRIVELGIGEK